MFDKLKLIFLDYLHANRPARHAILQASLGQLQLDSNLFDLNQALVFHAQLLQYAKLIDDIENQRPFGFLADYRIAMDEQGVDFKDFTFKAHHLGQYFEIEKHHLRLLMVPEKIPVEAYVVFQAFQKQVMQNNPNFNFTFNPLKPDKNLIYPVLIQGLGQLHNTAVDHIYVNDKGEVLFAKNRFGYQLPGGGMLNKPMPSRKDILKKVLDEYLEEQQSSLYRYTYIFDELGDAFRLSLNKVIEKGNEDHQFPGPLKEALKNIIQSKNKSNAKILQECIEIIDEEIASPALKSLRASIQLEPFKKHQLYQKGLDFLDKSELVLIEQFLDVRALASTQKSYCALLKEISLEDWFKSQGLKDSSYGDDLTGSKSEMLNFYQAIQSFKEVRFSHLLIFLAAINQRSPKFHSGDIKSDLLETIHILEKETLMICGG